MAGIPKRRAGERPQSYRLRCLDAELIRRVPSLVKRAQAAWQAEIDRHYEAMAEINAELSRCYRAMPGTKYDRTAKKGKGSRKK